jgi:aminopeptidase N
MENRLTFLTPTAITGDRSTTTLITHELAHSWTGNLVTNASWDDFWLNEGWTSYAEARISEVVEGDEITRLECIVNLDLLREDLQTLGPDRRMPA